MRDILFNFLKLTTMKTHTDITIILDCSGSISNIKKASKTGIKRAFKTISRQSKVIIQKNNSY